MYTLRDIEKRIDEVDKKIRALENNAYIYQKSNRITEAQQRFAKNKKDYDQQKAYLDTLESLHQYNAKDLQKITDIAQTARAELASLNQALEELNKVSITFTSERIYKAQKKLTKLWPLNQRDQHDRCICPITNRTIESNPVILSNGCQYSKEGLEQLIDGEKYYPRYLPGSTFPLMQLDKENISNHLSIAGFTAVRTASVFYTTTALVGLFAGGLGVGFIFASLFFPPLLPVGISLLCLGVSVAAFVAPLLSLLSAGVGYMIGKTIDSASIPSDFAPEIKSNRLNSLATLHQAMDVKPGQKKEYKEEKRQVSDVQYIPINPNADLTPQYISSNKLI